MRSSRSSPPASARTGAPARPFLRRLPFALPIRDALPPLEKYARLEHKGWIAAEWGESENKRKAKFYALTAAGRKQLKAETASWNRFSMVVASVLRAVPEES